MTELKLEKQLDIYLCPLLYSSFLILLCFGFSSSYSMSEYALTVSGISPGHVVWYKRAS